MINPIVSIIIPTYNRAHLIGETLDSVMAQTYKNWECIIVDDDSKDNTEEVINNYIKKDSRFQYHQRPKDLLQGGNAARNYGFELSKGQYVNWFDSDDIMHSEKLQIQTQILTNDFAIDFAVCQSGFFKTDKSQVLSVWNKNILDEDPLNSFILKKIGWSILAPLWRKDSLKRYNLKFDEDLKNGQDLKFHIDALLNNFKPFVTNEIFVFARMHENQIKSSFKKGISKTIIFEYFYHNRSKLNSETTLYVKNNLVELIRKLYLEKESKRALRLSVSILSDEVSYSTLFRIVKYNVWGSLYCLTGKGYSMLSAKQIMQI